MLYIQYKGGILITEKQYGLVDTEQAWEAGALFLALSLTYYMT